MPPSQAGTKVAGKGIKHCVEGGGLPLKAAAGREQILRSKGTKPGVEGGSPAKTAAAAEVKPPH